MGIDLLRKQFSILGNLFVVCLIRGFIALILSNTWQESKAAYIYLPQVFSAWLSVKVKMATHTVSYVTAAVPEPTKRASLIT